MPTKNTGTCHQDQAILRQIVQGSPIPTYVINTQHMVIHWNNALEKLSGYGAAELLGSGRHWVIYQAGKRQTLADAVVAEKPPGALKPYDGSRISPSELIEGAFEAEAFFPNMGENGRWLFITAAPIRRSDGKIMGAMETLWDKTEEKRAALNLKRHNSELSVLCAVSEALCKPLDLAKRLELACLEIAGLFSGDVLGIFCCGPDGKFLPIDIFGADKAYHHTRRPDGLVALLKQAAESGEVTTTECLPEIVENEFSSGLKKHYKCIYLVPLRTEEVLGILLLGSTMSSGIFPEVKHILELMGNRIGAALENARLHQQLVASERMAAIGQTAAGLAHYIKNILLGLKGGSYILDLGFNKNDMDKMTGGWQSVKTNIRRISELVTDLLTYSKDRTPEFQKCSPNDIAHDVCTLMEAELKKNNITLIEVFDPAIGELFMDSQTVHRSLLNLVSNAMDACTMDETPGKDHRITVKTTLEQKGSIRFEVHDNGMGMEDDVLKQLFTALFSTKGGKGTGLGLLITQKLVQEHDGHMDVTSHPGKGSVFTIRLPYKETPDDSGRTANELSRQEVHPG
jgi:signal transduction histidine kinase